MRNNRIAGFTVYWTLWGVSLIGLLALVHLAPKQAIWLMSWADPISSRINDFFWSLMPQGTWLVRLAVKIFAWILLHVASLLLSDQVMAALRLAFLDGLIVVTVNATAFHVIVSRYVKRRMIRKFMYGSGRKPETEELPVEEWQRMPDGRLEPRFTSPPLATGADVIKLRDRK